MKLLIYLCCMQISAIMKKIIHILEMIEFQKKIKGMNTNNTSTDLNLFVKRVIIKRIQ